MPRQIESKAPEIGLQATAFLAASFLSGKQALTFPRAMLSLSAIAIPVFLDTDSEATSLLRQWARLYDYGHLYMPAVSVATTGLYGYSALRQRAAHRAQWGTYAAAGATTISMVPFTWLVMAGTNNSLFQLQESAAVELRVVRALVVRWAWLHVARSVFPLAGALLGLVGVLRELGL